MQEYPAPKKALKQYMGTNTIASSVISLDHATTSIEMAAVGATAYMRWVPQTETAAVAPAGSVIAVAGSTSNWDHVIPAGVTRRFVVPRETAGASPGSVVGLNRQEGLYQRVAYITPVAASVLTSEF
jgi:hypothetical protein